MSAMPLDDGLVDTAIFRFCEVVSVGLKTEFNREIFENAKRDDPENHRIGVEAMRAALETVRGEPVAWQRFSDRLGWTAVDADYAQRLKQGGERVRPLYAAPETEVTP